MKNFSHEGLFCVVNAQSYMSDVMKTTVAVKAFIKDAFSDTVLSD